MNEIIRKTDYILLTHLHPDHWDGAAEALVPKSKQLICQPEDVETLQAQGFHHLLYQKSIQLQGVTIERVAAQHGHGELADKMAPVSGFVLITGNKALYVAGDTVWYEGVKTVLDTYKPDVSIVNAGSAQFQFGDPITMTAEDVLQVVHHSKPGSKTVVVHMEAINHCLLKRNDLSNLIKAENFSSCCFVPHDGEEIIF